MNLKKKVVPLITAMVVTGSVLAAAHIFQLDHERVPEPAPRIELVRPIYGSPEFKDDPNKKPYIIPQGDTIENILNREGLTREMLAKYNSGLPKTEEGKPDWDSIEAGAIMYLPKNLEETISN